MEVLRKLTTNNDDERLSLAFHCPGCKSTHSVCVKQGRIVHGDTWTWNGDMVKPTIRASVLCRWHDPEDGYKFVCHSYVTDGQIQYLNDCTHELAGQTINLPIWDND